MTGARQIVPLDMTAKRVLIVVQNLPVPLDRRVWLECRALYDAGFDVSVICPKGPGDPSYAALDGVHLFKYQPAPPAQGFLGFAWEFCYSWLRTAMLSIRVQRRVGFDVLQACNPPDTYWLLAKLWKLATGGRITFVYDQHDLNPEVFLSRFGPPRGIVKRAQYAMLCWLERRTYATADHVIATNESYRQAALTRGNRRADEVTVVRSGPDTARMRPIEGRPELRRGRRYLACYLGIMGPQDGVDVALRALAHYVHDMGRSDLHLALLGFGDCFDELRSLADELKLNDYVTFTGRADARMISEYLSSADIGISPDPLNPLNDVSTMNKTMEYMAFALPVVAFDLKETRVSAGDAAVYVTPGDVAGFAKAIAMLLDDEEARVRMALAARARAAAVLDWEPQRRAYVGVFTHLIGTPPPRKKELSWPAVDRRRAVKPGPLVDSFGNRLVDLRGHHELALYVPLRRLPENSPAPSAGEADVDAHE
jgi:glycosyltransferase involved in cell wall biosynthesis